MKAITFTFTIICLVLLLPFAVFAQQKGAPLSDAHKKFLEDVNWIISDYERNAFVSLKSEADRERFIKAFWDSRDPTPGTPKNEFKEEHYKRLEYVNKFFGRQSPLPGWKT